MSHNETAQLSPTQQTIPALLAEGRLDEAS
jgi:hypothetical protein